MKYLFRKLLAFTVISILTMTLIVGILFGKELFADYMFQPGIRTLSGEPAPSPPTRYILITYWTTWCKVCESEIPDLKRIDKNPDVTVVAVNVGESKRVVTAYMAEKDITYSVLLGAEQSPNARVPFHIILKDGQQVDQIAGKLPPEVVNALAK